LANALAMACHFGEEVIGSIPIGAQESNKGEMMESEDSTATCQCGCRLRDGEIREEIAREIEADARKVQARMDIAGRTSRPLYFIDGMNRAVRIARGF